MQIARSINGYRNMDPLNLSKYTLEQVKKCLSGRLTDHFQNDECTAETTYEMDLDLLHESIPKSMLYKFAWEINTELKQTLDSTLGCLPGYAEVSILQLATVFDLTFEYALDVDVAAERIYEFVDLVESQGKKPIKVYLKGDEESCKIDPSAAVFRMQALVQYE
jgi:hypothetical protein